MKPTVFVGALLGAAIVAMMVRLSLQPIVQPTNTNVNPLAELRGSTCGFSPAATTELKRSAEKRKFTDNTLPTNDGTIIEGTAIIQVEVESSGTPWPPPQPPYRMQHQGLVTSLAERL